jgi:hypothetical protein
LTRCGQRPRDTLERAGTERRATTRAEIKRRVVAVTTTLSGSAADCAREATLSALPNTSALPPPPAPITTVPVSIPTRTESGRYGGRLTILRDVLYVQIVLSCR